MRLMLPEMRLVWAAVGLAVCTGACCLGFLKWQLPLVWCSNGYNSDGVNLVDCVGDADGSTMSPCSQSHSLGNIHKQNSLVCLPPPWCVFCMFGVLLFTPAKGLILDTQCPSDSKVMMRLFCVELSPKRTRPVSARRHGR
jgi:hypothetical protein